MGTNRRVGAGDGPTGRADEIADETGANPRIWWSMRTFFNGFRLDPLTGAVVIMMMLTLLTLGTSVVVRFTVSDGVWEPWFVAAPVFAIAGYALAYIRRQRMRTR